MTQICLAANTSWYLYNFRRTTIDALLAHGYTVDILAPEDSYTRRLARLGCRVHALSLDQSGTQLLREAASLFAVTRALYRARADVLLSFTPKLNIYGGLAARALGVPQIANVSGLGAHVPGHGMRQLYRASLCHAHRVVFQNRADRLMFAHARLVRPGQALDLLGSGVDLARFRASAMPNGGPVRFLFLGRLLREKGPALLAEAAARVHRALPGRACFDVVGPLATGRRNAVTRQEVQAWEQAGLLRYHGATECAEGAILDSHCVVLPTYYGEGVPKTLLEAAACARPVIASDIPGCRAAVIPGVTGLLTATLCIDSLTAALMRFVTMPAAARAEMGRAARAQAEAAFSDRANITAYLGMISELCRKPEQIQNAAA